MYYLGVGKHLPYCRDLGGDSQTVSPFKTALDEFSKYIFYGNKVTHIYHIGDQICYFISLLYFYSVMTTVLLYYINDCWLNNGVLFCPTK